MRIFKLLLLFVQLLSQSGPTYVDGIAAVIEDNIILKSDVAQMVNITAAQSRIDPANEADKILKLQESVLGSMIDQKILLEMAVLDSIFVDEKEVDNALEQQIQVLISESGGKKRAEKILGQSISEFRREFWYDMQDRLVSEKYQQQLLNSISATRKDVVDFYYTFKDSLPLIPQRTKVKHLLITIEPSKESKKKSFNLLLNLKDKILGGEDFSVLASSYSEDPGSKDNGGSLGWVTRGSLVKSFETAAFTAEIGKVVGPVETDFGFHLIETIDKKGEKIKVRHILSIPEKTNTDTERAYNFATRLKEDSIKTMNDFDIYVFKYTKDESTKKIGGNLGWIEAENYSIPEIGQALKYLEMNTCSPPINSSYGFHLVWIEGIKKGGVPNLKDHWIEIELMTLNKKKMDWYQKWIKNARENFFINIKSL
tara:strand:+ start:2872 stop:4149 length:1278 start_codon:yes stop_codon:yes gene_type:complete